MPQQTIILAMSSYSDFACAIKTHLEYHNYKVIFIDSTSETLKKKIEANFHYPSLKTHIINTIRKIFLFDFTYKAVLKEQIYHQELYENIQNTLGNHNYDYTLVIRPDLFSIATLELLKSHTKKKLIGYQWNGIKRFPKTIPTINLFDRFFVFDPLDVNNPEYSQFHLKGMSNFYFDMYHPQPVPHKGLIAYFVGLHFDNRTKALQTCAKALIENGVNLDFNIKLRPSEASKAVQYTEQNICLIAQNISFEDNLKHVNKADILIDIVNPIHNGLSFRVFEALYYRKKLITNNSYIKNYDFYHPDNIFIWTEEKDLQQLSDFLVRPLISIHPDIISKYSFANWIKNILDDSPYKEISVI
ncbi:MAG: hypothetical protein ACRCR8_08905 [Snodgrassella alvi]